MFSERGRKEAKILRGSEARDAGILPRHFSGYAETILLLLPKKEAGSLNMMIMLPADFFLFLLIPLNYFFYIFRFYN